MPALYSADEEHEGEAHAGFPVAGPGPGADGGTGGNNDNNWAYWDPSWVADCKKLVFIKL